MTKHIVKPSNLALNIQSFVLIDLEESHDSDLGLLEKNTPSPLRPPPPREFDFAYNENSLPIFCYEPIDENPLASKYGHVEYDPELFNPQQFDYGSPDDNSPTQEPCDEHISEVSSALAIPSIISQLQKKNKNIKKLKIVLKSYEQAQ